MALLLALSIGGIGIAAYLRTKCWSHPAVIFCLFWCAMTAIPIIAVPEAHASVSAILFILAAALAYSAPSFFFDWSGPRTVAARRSANQTSSLDSKMVLFAALGCQTLPVVLAALNLEHQGYSMWDAVLDPIKTACLYLADRYAGRIDANIFSTAATVLNYIGAPLCGIVLTRTRSWPLRVLVFVLAFVPSIIAVLVYADKGTIFLSASFVLGGCIVARVAAGNTALVTRNTLIAGVCFVAIVVPVMMLAMLNRGDGECADASRTQAILETLSSVALVNADPSGSEEISGRSEGMLAYLRSYAFAHVFAFSDWFESYLGNTSVMRYTDPPGATWAFWTFMAIGERVYPSYVLPPGYFDEYFSVPGIITSNIYTMYRGMIYDFTIPGALVFMALFGLVSALIYRRMLEREMPPVAASSYIGLAGVIYTSYIISVLIWTSVYVAFVGVLIALTASHFLWERRRRWKQSSSSAE